MGWCPPVPSLVVASRTLGNGPFSTYAASRDEDTGRIYQNKRQQLFAIITFNTKDRRTPTIPRTNVHTAPPLGTTKSGQG